MLAILAGMILGATMGVAVAYWRSTNRRRFESAREPEDVLHVPLLAQIPESSGDELTELNLPSVVDPASAGGDAYRTVVDALRRSLDLSHADGHDSADPSSQQGTVLAVISGRSGEGRADVSVNAAFAAARSRLRVLLIDGDADRKNVSRLLHVVSSHGYSAPMLQTVSTQPIEWAPIRTFGLDDGTRLDVMEHEPQLRSSPKSIDPTAVASALHTLADRYDLIIIDEPPLLGNAPSGRTVVHADRALIVVSHGGEVADADDLRYRLKVLGVEPVGYVYRATSSESRFGPFSRDPEIGGQAGSHA